MQINSFTIQVAGKVFSGFDGLYF